MTAGLAIAGLLNIAAAAAWLPHPIGWFFTVFAGVCFYAVLRAAPGTDQEVADGPD